MGWQLEDLPPHLREQARRKLAADAPAAPPEPAETFALSVCPDEKAARKTEKREQAEQIAFLDRVRASTTTDPATGEVRARPGREGAELVFALANENAGGRGIGILRWKMGVRAGLPDVGVFVPRISTERRGYVWSGLFIELKCSGGVASDVRPSQRAVHEALRAAGYKVAVCFGEYAAWACLCEYLGWEG